MLFENCKNSKKQGDVGEACAIFEYTKLGYVVAKPLCDSAKYDLLVEKDGIIKRVQVKTTRRLLDGGSYTVELATKNGNKSGQTVHKRLETDYDELFVLNSVGERWVIPVSFIGGTTGITLGKKYDDFKL